VFFLLITYNNFELCIKYRITDVNHYVNGENIVLLVFQDPRLLAALVNKTEIPLPNFETVDDEQYEKLYPPVFTEPLPEDYITIANPAFPQRRKTKRRAKPANK